MNIADYTLIGIIIVSMIIGGVRGIIMSVYGLLTTILSVFLAFKFSQPIKDLLVGTSFYNSIHEKIENMVEALVPNLDSIEDTIVATINSLPFPDDIKLWLINGIDFSQATTKAEAMGGLVVTITDFIIAIIIGIVLFILLIIIFKLLKGLIKKISDLPVIKQVDSIVGAIIGAASGVLLGYIICLVISGFQTTEVMIVIHETIQESKLASVLYNNNILLEMFKK
jgi:uncharacterized membrane protein required for colicin V production